MKITKKLVLGLLMFSLTACTSDGKNNVTEETTVTTTEATTEDYTEKETETESTTESTTEKTEEETTEEEKEEVDYSKYYEIIDRIESLNFDNVPNNEVHPDLYNPENENISYLFFRAVSYEPLGYTFMDIDNNGIDELLLGESDEIGRHVIYNIFTLQEDNLVCVFSGWERYSCYITEGNQIAVHGSSGAAYDVDNVYDYSDGQLTYYDGVYTDQGDPEIIFYHGDGDVQNKETDPIISREEANAIKESYAVKSIKFTVFDRYKEAE